MHLQCKKGVTNKIKQGNRLGEGTRKRSPLKVANQLRALYLAHPLESRSIFLVLWFHRPVSNQTSFPTATQKPVALLENQYEAVRNTGTKHVHFIPYKSELDQLEKSMTMDFNSPSTSMRFATMLPRNCTLSSGTRYSFIKAGLGPGRWSPTEELHLFHVSGLSHKRTEQPSSLSSRSAKWQTRG